MTDSAVHLTASDRERIVSGFSSNQPLFDELLLIDLRDSGKHCFVWAYSEPFGQQYESQNVNRKNRVHLTP